jgi:hypothetical protein
MDDNKAAKIRAQIREEDSTLKRFALLISGFLLLCFAISLSLYDIKSSKSQGPGTVCFKIGK